MVLNYASTVMDSKTTLWLIDGLLLFVLFVGAPSIIKGAAIVASSKPGPFQEFYTALLTKGIRPEMARLTLARKIATIVLIVWKKGACFDAQHLKPQAA